MWRHAGEVSLSYLFIEYKKIKKRRHWLSLDWMQQVGLSCGGIEPCQSFFCLTFQAAEFCQDVMTNTNMLWIQTAKTDTYCCSEIPTLRSDLCKIRTSIDRVRSYRKPPTWAVWEVFVAVSLSAKSMWSLFSLILPFSLRCSSESRSPWRPVNQRSIAIIARHRVRLVYGPGGRRWAAAFHFVAETGSFDAPVDHHAYINMQIKETRLQTAVRSCAAVQLVQDLRRFPRCRRMIKTKKTKVHVS